MKPFVRFCLSRPITTLTVHILLVLGGILSIDRIPLSATPNLGRMSVNINIPYPNASPIQVENEVVRPLEEALATKEEFGQHKLKKTGSKWLDESRNASEKHM